MPAAQTLSFSRLVAHKKSLSATQREGFFCDSIRLKFFKLPRHRLFARKFSQAVGVNLLPQPSQQSAVTLSGLLCVFQYLKAGVYQLRKIFYGVGTFRR